MSRPEGEKSIQSYYDIAPKIVRAIEQQEDAKQIYRKLWNEKIEPCYQLINDHKFEEAYQTYLNTIVFLSEKYLSDSLKSRHLI